MIEFDLTKPFVHTYREGEYTVIETNLPNDTCGDFAFEWDIDGSQRRKWEEYLKDLEEKGIRGKLVHKKMKMLYNPVFDEQPELSPLPLSSYEMKIVDFGEIDTWNYKTK